ncbi:methyltransferase domain-containing protein [Nonomuraea sp. NPDC049725]|uniref:SAM-dependent methyltransferase n=1 Tax=Nonomuraea sp. NPDC049725 TaxID=3154508 RepID=UPI003441D01C
MAVPERLAWAVDTLGVQAGERILEIGCGRGVAVELACDAGATVTAIDRSATMIEAARQRNAHHVAAGRAILRTAALTDADLLGRLRLDGFATEVLTGGDTLLCVRARPEGQVSA